ncbi:trimeric LpxA-like protein [Kockiozyma suomiensis]|uniref:trimeric LpxA-like protein n=1 Tax=Kockiozyma suomiensis TaxID=1337062 RepID=UPI003343B2B8
MAHRQTRAGYIETESGNRISRNAVIAGSQHILMGGRSTVLPECVIRGDLKRVSTSASSSASVSIGRYAFLDKQVLLRPPFKIYKGALTYYPVQIGNFVSIGSGTVVEAASLGSYIMIGKNCIVDKFAIIKDCVVVRDGAVIPSTVCIPPFSIVSGNPATVVATLPESAADFLERYSRQLYALHGQMLNADCITEIMSSVFDDQIDTEVNFE